MDNLPIGTYVVNKECYWCSGFLVSVKNTNEWVYFNDQIDRGKRRELKRLGTHKDCDSNIREIGFKGVVVDYKNYVHLIRWDDGTLCGKPIDAISVDYQRVRQDKLNTLGL